MPKLICNKLNNSFLGNQTLGRLKLRQVAVPYNSNSTSLNTTKTAVWPFPMAAELTSTSSTTYNSWPTSNIRSGTIGITYQIPFRIHTH
jgi:hypothetical protein